VIKAPPEGEPLSGFAIGVTAARRHEELGALLERRGARVVLAPAIRLVPLADDAALLHVTKECITEPLDYVVVTTGIGFRAWLETADGWGLHDDLVDSLRGVRILTRGPKARGAIRQAGLVE
jgi:uroporphyrinogen-III synthase